MEGEGKACIFMVVLTSEPLVAGSSSSSDSTSSQGTLFLCTRPAMCEREEVRKEAAVGQHSFSENNFEYFFLVICFE